MEIVENVSEFIRATATTVGLYEKDAFHATAYCECKDLAMESPIEQIVYVAVKALAKMQGVDEATSAPVNDNGELHMPGLNILPQHHIGKYRVDFYMTHERKWRDAWERQEIVVECDSQQFHERTEPERRYEKQRDRKLSAQGYRVLHFTGSEIVRDPWKIAAEIIEAVCTDKPSADEMLAMLERYRR